MESGAPVAGLVIRATKSVVPTIRHGGPAQVAKSPADGYTLLINTSAQAYSAALLKNLPYDPLKDFIPIAPLTSQPYVLVAGKAAGCHHRRRAHCGGEGEAR